MKKFIKNLGVVAVFGASFISVEMQTQLEATDAYSSSQAQVLEPDKVPSISGLRASNVVSVSQSLTRWFSENGGTFLKDKYPGGLPTRPALVRSKLWWQQSLRSRIGTSKSTG
ncbi:MAG: hypothetical protein NT128_00760 [Proteobacteria bacterium]|nr:hypothetical protein [Pseudomonadota bacterium]